MVNELHIAQLNKTNNQTKKTKQKQSNKKQLPIGITKAVSHYFKFFFLKK